MSSRHDPEEAHKQALEETGFWGRKAAGAIVYARATGRYLLQLRSEEVQHGNTWGVWGGAIDEGHDPEDCVRAELNQETQHRGRVDLYFVVDYVDGPSGFRYSNYVAVVDDEFEPILNWEGAGFGWFEPGNWPEPMHFGLRFLLDYAPDPISFAQNSSATYRMPSL